MAITLTQKLAALGGDLDALIEKLGRVQGATQATRSQIDGVLADLHAEVAAADAAVQSLSGNLSGMRELRRELQGAAADARAAVGETRTLASVGVQGLARADGQVSSGGMTNLLPLDDLERARRTSRAGA